LRELNFIFYSGRYITIWGFILTIIAILKNKDVYNVPKHLKKENSNRIIKLIFSIFIAWMVPGITGSISEVFSSYTLSSTMLYHEPEFIREVFLFIYSNFLPIVFFYYFLKRYYSNNN